MARSNDIYEIPDTPPRLRIPRRQLNTYGQKKTARAALRVFEELEDIKDNSVY
jgi:hypothetical protein